MTEEELKNAADDGVYFYDYSTTEFPEKVIAYRYKLFPTDSVKDVIAEFYGDDRRILAYSFLTVMRKNSIMDEEQVKRENRDKSPTTD